MEWIAFVPEYLLPFIAVIVIGFAIVKVLRDQATTQATAAIEVTPEILEGVRNDLKRATDETEAARKEAEAARQRAEAAETARDEERAARRRVEDDFHDYRVNARTWTARLVAQVVASGNTPVEAPEGFDV